MVENNISMYTGCLISHQNLSITVTSELDNSVDKTNLRLTKLVIYFPLHFAQRTKRIW